MMIAGSLNGRDQPGLVFGVLLTFAAVAAAGDTYWQHDPATPGGWFDPANRTAGVLTPADTATIDNGRTAAVPGGAAEASVLVDDFEVAGEGKGASASWTGNFALGSLQLGTGTVTECGRIKLADFFENQPGWPGAEALYTGTLILNAGAVINLNGVTLSYLNAGDLKQFFNGDATLDGALDGLDYVAWSSNFLTGDTWEKGDCNGDGVADGLDYVIWSNNYLGGCPSLPGPVPEPSSALVLVLCICALRRRRHGG